MKQQQASNTAKVIAASTILLASDPRTAAQVAPGAEALCRKFLSTTWIDRVLAGSASLPLTRALWRWLERLTLPGIVTHYWRRKRWIEARCRKAIAEGFTRIIVIGAGLDTLGCRLAGEFEHISIVEVDHPATQKIKRRTLGDDSSHGRLRFVALDLGGAQLPAELPGDGSATIVVIEGLLMYLMPVDIDRLFATLRSLQAPRVRMLFSFMTQWPDGRVEFRPRSRWIERWLAWRDEPFTWGFEPESMRGFLAERRFRLLELALPRQFTEESGTSALDGENLVCCEPD
jgi:methyltransferase (TIGR00027 family)